MRTSMSFITALSVAASALAPALVSTLAGCVVHEAAPDAPDTGTLTLPLTQTGPHGEQFRLTHATFDLAGGSGFAQTVTSGVESEIVLPVPPGPTTIQLRDGWSLEQLASGAFVPVDALLGSANPAFVRMLASQPAVAEFDFLVRSVDGTLTIRLGVVNTPRELAGPMFIDQATGGLAAYAGKRLDFAIFFDLAALDRATLVDGSKQLTYTAGPAALELYNDALGTLAPLLETDQTGGFLQYTVTARPGGTIELAGSMLGQTSVLSFGPHAIDTVVPPLDVDGFPADAFFLDFSLPFTLDATATDGAGGTLSGVIRPRHLLPAPWSGPSEARRGAPEARLGGTAQRGTDRR